jgi:hypothetical protein
MSETSVNNNDNEKSSLSNLKPFKKGQLSSEEAKKRGSIGGKKSALSRQRSKLFKDVFTTLWDVEVTDKEHGLINYGQMAALQVFRKAVNDKDLEAFKIVRDTLGQKPSDKTEVKLFSFKNFLEQISDEDIDNKNLE